MLEDDIVAKLNEIVDARYNDGATIITTQLRMSNMKEVIKTQGVQDLVYKRFMTSIFFNFVSKNVISSLHSPVKMYSLHNIRHQKCIITNIGGK